MGAKKNKHIAILTHKENEAKAKAQAMTLHGISQIKIDAVKAKETKYKNWRQTIQGGPDY